MIILGVNGVGTDGKDNTDVLGRELTKLGHKFIDANYRIMRLFRFQTYDRGRQFEDASYIGKNYIPSEHFNDCVLIAHSRGCLVAWRMLEIGYRFRAVFLFRPAINRDFILPQGQHQVYCIHRPDDRAIKWGGRLLFNDFGNGGRFGMEDDRVINIEAPRYKDSEFWQHSDDFLYPQVRDWAKFIDEKLMFLK